MALLPQTHVSSSYSTTHINLLDCFILPFWQYCTQFAMAGLRAHGRVIASRVKLFDTADKGLKSMNRYLMLLDFISVQH
ncbi:hypothetical protein JL49_03675 [Pseudoalteromonas luteoviolacea]|uniref:Uncharacterized protein n=1 Tax=Pseudoalteromonas luteoviolacea NCIMB 1942 TaxID=1365253 RepID=A0A167ATY3_9GAMM|nr:hypothetical protein N482_13905 [Pseudoalteromonas luteoviolacea NCIMB 1942]KZX01857.1 hypothetical protein JL49_03675 [Pseudoalteromonas luteoviolacea]